MVDLYEVAAVTAAMIFNISMVHQWRTLENAEHAEGISTLQWVGFFCASIVFAMFYIHLHQLLMASVSFGGALICARIVILVHKKRRQVAVV